MVVAEREQNWMIYTLPERRPVDLARNLKCLQDCVQTDAVFKRDLQKLFKLRKRCCGPSRLFARGNRERRINAEAKSSIPLRS